MSVIVWASPSNLICCSENFIEMLIFELILGKNHEVIPKCLLPIMKQANLGDFFLSAYKHFCCLQTVCTWLCSSDNLYHQKSIRVIIISLELILEEVTLKSKFEWE